MFEDCQICQYQDELTELISMTPEDTPPENHPCFDCPIYEQINRHINQDFVKLKEIPLSNEIIDGEGIFEGLRDWPIEPEKFKDKLTAPEIATWALYRSGFTQQEIADHEGVSQPAVIKRLRKISIKLKG